MKLTAESTVINDAKINTDIDTAQTTANDAKTIADNTNQYFWFTSSGTDTGAHITETTQAQFLANPSGGNLLARSNGIAVRDGMTELATFGTSATIGKTTDGHTTIASSGMKVYGSDGTVELANIGYGSGATTSGEVADAPYFTFGTRASNSIIGNNSFAEGYSVTASGANSHAEGAETSATKQSAHAEGLYTTANASVAHAEGQQTTAHGYASHAEGYYTTANGSYSHSGGNGTIAAGAAQTAIGTYNIEDSTSLFIVGNGTISNRNNAFSIASDGTVYVNGTSVHSSDRRLKEHIAYLDDEAVEFIDGLKPAHYIKDGEKHVGFYAQDVKEVDKWGCMLGEEMNGYMTLSYMDLIAPLVTYCQKLEKRINKLESEGNNE